jgi:beta-lactamase superfamily II metal-dependent hydrolase
VATLLDRPSLSINTLAVAFFVLLVSNTNQLFDTGFQLSFTVVAAIVLLSGSITRWLQTFTHPDPFIPRKLLTPLQKSRWLIANKLSGSVALTLAAWAGSLPLTAVYFNLMSPVAIVANLFILPIAFGILALGVLSVAFAWTGAWLSIAFNNASWACVNVLLLILSGCTALPHSSFFVGPHWWQLPHKQRITFFDLGAGGAALIETSGSCWLVDCGSDANYRRIVRAYLQKRGINHVDGIVLTHGDSSHIGGFEQFRKDFPDAAVYLPEAGRKSLGFRKVAIADVAQPLEAGTSLTLGREARMDVLWPGTRVDGGRADDHCLILRLILMDQTFLLTSDSGLSAEMDLLTGNNETAVRADWLVIGRHRDDPGGSEEFLQEVGAGRVLSTAARFPASEKVPPELAEICHKHHMQLLPFDKTGAVQVELESGRVEVKTFLKAPELQARKASSY